MIFILYFKRNGAQRGCNIKSDAVRSNIQSTAAMESTVLWDVMPCSLVDLNKRFGRKLCPIFKVDKFL
jgi:hypothetical protein